MRRALVATILGLSLSSCDASPPTAAGTCAEALSVDSLVTDEAVLREVFLEVLEGLYPELAPATVELAPFTHESDFFVANFDVLTMEAPPLERRYVVRYNERLFDDPPSFAAVAGVLAHELKHILDYTTMESEAFNEFVAWYVTADDISEYERATDEHALGLGCGLALREYRLWLYEHISPEAVEQKRHDYYTPEEIDAWLAREAAE